jgi:hypothetical protein
MRVIQKLKIQNGWDGKGNNNREDGNPVVSSVLAHFVVVIMLVLTNMFVGCANLK